MLEERSTPSGLQQKLIRMKIILLLALQEICDEYHPESMKAQTISEEKVVRKCEYFLDCTILRQCWSSQAGWGAVHRREAGHR
jgi:hypothetical protein